MISVIISAIENDVEREFITGIYNSYYKQMKKQAYKIVRNDEDAEELVQDAFVNLIDRIDVVMSVSPQKLPSYVMATIRNIAINRWKNNKKDLENTFSFDDEDIQFWIKDDNALPEDLYIRKEALIQLNQKLSLLPERDYLLLEAKYVLKLKDEDISKQFNIATQSVRIYVMRARRKAYSLLKEATIYEK